MLSMRLTEIFPNIILALKVAKYAPREVKQWERIVRG